MAAPDDECAPGGGSIMKGLGVICAAAVLVVATFAGGMAFAADGGGEGESTGSAAVVAQAPTVRLAAVLSGGVSAGTFTLRRAKGVAHVMNPATGVFCIEPSATMALGRVVPLVSVEDNFTPDF